MARSQNHFCRGKEIIIVTYFESISVALFIRIARAPYCHLWCAGTIFGKTLLNIKCVFWLSVLFFVWNSSHSKKNSPRYCQNAHRSSCIKHKLFFSDFTETWILSTDFRKILIHQISLKFLQWKPSFPYGRTDKPIDRHGEASSRF